MVILFTVDGGEQEQSMLLTAIRSAYQFRFLNPLQANGSYKNGSYKWEHTQYLITVQAECAVILESKGMNF